MVGFTLPAATRDRASKRSLRSSWLLPRSWRWPNISTIGLIWIGPSGTPMFTKRPPGRSPAKAAAICVAELVVERMTLAPPASFSAFPGSSPEMITASAPRAEKLLLLVLLSGDGDGLEANGLGELHRQVAEAADAENRHALARLGIAVPEPAHDGVSGAEDR